MALSDCRYLEANPVAEACMLQQGDEVVRQHFEDQVWTTLHQPLVSIDVYVIHASWVAIRGQ